MSENLTHLKPAQCALLVVDIQERMMPVILERERVIRNSVLLMKTANTLNVPIIATTQYVAKIGALLPEIQAELNGVTPLDKFEFGCFGNKAIQKAAEALGGGVNTLIVCGVETHICIYQTVLGALKEGYNVWVASDAVSSRVPHNYETGLERIRQIGGIVGSTEMIIYDLLMKAGTDEFRALLPFLK
ncbi:MAG: isochorismatase family protein [Proteobacteria bacterium]|nr:isochorismatase family protein [Pseudomonadota bacterium]MBU1709568.1 isochorismatase family protein [Pseudomonadota bacterium]